MGSIRRGEGMKETWVPKRLFTEVEVEAAMTPKGGFNRESFARLGVPYPPPKGWREAITKKEYAIKVDGVWRRE
jgi:hypothetical protein